MSLFWHLATHVLLAALAGVISYRISGNFLWALLAALFWGVGVDMDHFIDYFMAFGLSFNMEYFKQGYQFLKSDKIYVFLHAWEYVLIFLVAFWTVKSTKLKTIFLASALGLLVHLSADVALNEIPAKSYTISYRIIKSFDIKELVHPDHYLFHLKMKEETPL